MAEDILETFVKYQEELKADVNVNELNMKDASLNVATVKHKWAGRLIRAKIDLSKMTRQRDEAVAMLVEQMQANPAVELSGPMMKRQAEKNDVIKELDNRIENTKLIIEYLEKIEKIVGSMTWDIKNIIELVKVETQ